MAPFPFMHTETAHEKPYTVFPMLLNENGFPGRAEWFLYRDFGGDGP